MARLLLYPLLHLTQSKIHLVPFSQVSADRLMYHYAMEQVTLRHTICYLLDLEFFIKFPPVFVFDCLVSKCCPQ